MGAVEQRASAPALQRVYRRAATALDATAPPADRLRSAGTVVGATVAAGGVGLAGIDGLVTLLNTSPQAFGEAAAYIGPAGLWTGGIAVGVSGFGSMLASIDCPRSEITTGFRRLTTASVIVTSGLALAGAVAAAVGEVGIPGMVTAAHGAIDTASAVAAVGVVTGVAGRIARIGLAKPCRKQMLGE